MSTNPSWFRDWHDTYMDLVQYDDIFNETLEQYKDTSRRWWPSTLVAATEERKRRSEALRDRSGPNSYEEYLDDTRDSVPSAH